MAVVSGERDPDAIRVLTVQNPWAYGIVEGLKTCENRSKRTRHRGRVAVHAGLGWSLRGEPIARDLILQRAAQRDGIGTHRNGMPGPGWVRGYVVGFVDLIGCHEGSGVCCAPFGERDAWHWMLDNAVRLATPIKARGQLGLWTPDRDLREALAVAT